MSINYCRLSVLASLIVVNAMSLVAHAGDVWIKTHEGKESMAVPLDIAKKIPTMAVAGSTVPSTAVRPFATTVGRTAATAISGSVW